MLIAVVGVGALGAQLVALLRNVKATIRIIDFDRVEAKNVQSQFYGLIGVNRPKVMALAQQMDMLFKVKLQTMGHRLTESNVSEMLSGVDLVIDCLDNAPSRRVVQQFVRGKGLECLHGAVDGAGTCGRIQWDERFEIEDSGPQGQPTCENGEHLPFLTMMPSYMAQAVKVFVDQGRRPNYQVTPTSTILTSYST
jgi:molybdopterin/thiamine biosynthesis adenylyltransferase